MQRRIRAIVVVLAVLAAAAGAVTAREVRVTRTNGRTLSGELVTESRETIVLRISGIDTTIARDDIVDIEYLQSPEERYQQQRDQLADNDLDGRYLLALELFNDKAYELAYQELWDLNQRFPNDPRVANLLNLVDQRIKLAQAPKGQRPAAAPGDEGPGAARRPADPAQDSPYLTDEQVNLIRVYEVDLEAQPRIMIPRDVTEAFYNEYADNAQLRAQVSNVRELMRKPGYEQLMLMFGARARQHYGKAQVLDDPPAMSTYRRMVNPGYVSRYFKPMFGQGQVEGLTLHASASPTTNEIYTNFYELDSFSYEGRPMIDRQQPDQSLLLQWGLPREVASFKAPEVERWRPYFTSIDDPKFSEFVDWIGTLYTPRPDYGIDGAAPTAPAVVDEAEAIREDLAPEPEEATK